MCVIVCDCETFLQVSSRVSNDEGKGKNAHVVPRLWSSLDVPLVEPAGMQ